MCGRTACALAPDDVVARCRYRGRGSGKQERPVWRDAPGGKKYYPSHNIAPASHTPILLSSRHYGEELEEVTERVIQPMKWGLTPSWHKGDPYKIEYETNNCRAEGMLTKRTYKVPLEKGRRCVVLAEGFFEWKRDQKVKQPYYIYFPKTDSKDGVLKEEKSDIKSEIKSENSTSPVKREVKTESVDPDSLPKVKREPEDEADLKTEVKQEADVKMERSEVGGSTSDVKTEVKEESNNGEESSGPKLLTMAGVFDVWTPPDGSEPLYSYSIITVDASPWMHHQQCHGFIIVCQPYFIQMKRLSLGLTIRTSH